MKPKYLVIGMIIAIIIVLAIALTLKSGKTSQETVPPTSGFQQ